MGGGGDRSARGVGARAGRAGLAPTRHRRWTRGAAEGAGQAHSPAEDVVGGWGSPEPDPPSQSLLQEYEPARVGAWHSGRLPAGGTGRDSSEGSEAARERAREAHL